MFISYTYVVEKEVLYVQDKDKEKDLNRKCRVIVKREETQKILSMCHDGIDGMHVVRDKTYGKYDNSCVYQGMIIVVCINV